MTTDSRNYARLGGREAQSLAETRPRHGPAPDFATFGGYSPLRNGNDTALVGFVVFETEGKKEPACAKSSGSIRHRSLE